MKKKIEEKKWRDILSEINENVTDVSYRTWFAPLVPLEVDEDAKVFYVASSNDFAIGILKTRYISTSCRKRIQKKIQGSYKRKNRRRNRKLS